ncbi:hypothetical protein C8J57DRAFT_1510760 [Mycena rebaudengoi]|nr:hypothetical protein C8J57DRAFT_1510760 [Mycena rebaudengoi]
MAPTEPSIDLLVEDFVEDQDEPPWVRISVRLRVILSPPRPHTLPLSLRLLRLLLSLCSHSPPSLAPPSPPVIPFSYILRPIIPHYLPLSFPSLSFPLLYAVA